MPATPTAAHPRGSELVSHCRDTAPEPLSPWARTRAPGDASGATTDLVSRALVWVRAMLFGPSSPDRRAAPDTDSTGIGLEAAAGAPARRPSPEMWGAILAGARRRRASPRWPDTRLPAITANDIASTLVGAYLLPPDVRQHALSAEQFAKVS